MRHRKVISFVLAFDEPIFLPRWIRYYSRIGEIEVSTEAPPFEWGKFIEWHLDRTHTIATTLHKKYDIVVTSDVDEFLVPDLRKYRDLNDYISQWDGDYTTARGYHVVDTSRLYGAEKRKRYWLSDVSYNKTLISNVPLRYVHGRHSMQDRKDQLDENLYLVHLRREDYERCLERNRSRRHWDLRAEHHWMLEGDEYYRWFYEINTGRHKLLEPIPDWMVIPE